MLVYNHQLTMIAGVAIFSNVFSHKVGKKSFEKFEKLLKMLRVSGLCCAAVHVKA